MAGEIVEEEITVSSAGTATLRDPCMTDTSVLELRKVRDRELMLKRLAGEISCAECRRMKLKCDKKIPCTACIKRKCSGICPIASMLDEDSADLMKARRFKGSKERQLILMSRRICILEDALFLSQESGDTHPLLAHELLRIKQKDGLWAEEEEPQHEENDWNDTGTLIIGERDDARYCGSSATEYVLLSQLLYSEEKILAHRSLYTGLPPEIVQSSVLFPFTPYLTKPPVYAEILSRLPEYPRVTALIEAYFSNLAWFAGPIDRLQLQEELIPLFYPKRRRLSPAAFQETTLHSLALLLTFLACGSVADLTLDPINPEAEELDQLAKATLSLRSIFDYGSLEACQALMLLGSYGSCTGRKSSSDGEVRLVNFGIMVAISLGLHRDPARFGLEPKVAERRRRIFWQLNSIDKSKTLGTGQPMTFDPSSIDCEFPFDQNAIQEKDGVVVESVWHWRYRFSRDVLTPISEAISSAKRVKYSKILELNDLVQKFLPHTYSMREAKALPNDRYSSRNDQSNLMNYLHPLVTVWYKEMAIEKLHRNYFARAIIESPSDPRKSVYGSSFKAVFDSSKILLKLIALGYPKLDTFLLRLPTIWANSLACTVVIASVAARVKVPEIADDALQVLDVIVETFRDAKKHAIPVASLPFLLSLQKRAREAHDERNTQKSESLALSLPYIRDTRSTLEEELQILRGGTLFLSCGPQLHSSDGMTILNENNQSNQNLSSIKVPSPLSSAPSGRFTAGVFSSSDEMSTFYRLMSPSRPISEITSPVQFMREATRTITPIASASSAGALSSSSLSSALFSSPTSTLYGIPKASVAVAGATNGSAFSAVEPSQEKESLPTAAARATSFEAIFGFANDEQLQLATIDSSPEDFSAADTAMWDNLMNDFGFDIDAILA